jgi:hypothetical protein
LDYLLYDDGSLLTSDESGVVVAAQDSGGASVPVARSDGGITQQFMDMVTNGVQALIDNRLPPAPAPRIGVQPPAAQQVSALLASPTVKLAGLALLGFFLYKQFA